MAKNLLQNSCDLVSVTPTAGTNQVATPQGLVKVSSQTVVAVTNVQFLGLANYPYKNYRIQMSNMQSSTAAFVNLNLSINNGSTFITTGYLSGATFVAYNSFTFANNNTTTSMYLHSNFIGGANTGYTVSADLYNINNPNQFVFINGQCSVANNSSLFMELLYGGYLTLITCNAIQISVSVGTVSGTFTLYGYS